MGLSEVEISVKKSATGVNEQAILFNVSEIEYFQFWGVFMATHSISSSSKGQI